MVFLSNPQQRECHISEEGLQHHGERGAGVIATRFHKLLQAMLRMTETNILGGNRPNIHYGCKTPLL